MKKIIGFSMLFVFLGFTTFAQSLELTKLMNEKNEKCVPTKECAEKMGMTLEQCKKLCSSKVASASAENNDSEIIATNKQCDKPCVKSKVASASAEWPETGEIAVKKQCNTPCSKTKVASVGAEKENLAKLVSENDETKKECKKKCTKKEKASKTE